MATQDETAAYTLAEIHSITDQGMRSLLGEDYREVMYQLDKIRERCCWVEKMMWRRLRDEAKV